MARLSSAIENIKETYSVVVIGSGYGGGIAASRLARAGQQVCVLERGREFFPGDFPDKISEARKELQIDTSLTHIGSETGLYDFRVNSDMNALVGCGLGGTSLINGSVILRADPRVFEEPVWPDAFIDDLSTGLEEGYSHATEMLRPSPYPTNFPKLRKLTAHEKSGKFMKENFYRPPLVVNFEEFEGGINHVGVEQKPCILASDCVTGCNFQAKNTVDLNYLPDARNHGAEIFTGIKAKFIEKKDAKWLVHCEQTLGESKSSEVVVSANIVVLSAGTLGSTEILLRSKEKGLNLSEMLGKNFTGNGDVLGFSYNSDDEINGIAIGDRKPDAKKPVGPAITGIIDTRKTENYREGMSIEDGSIPGALSGLMPLTFFKISKLIGEDTDRGFRDYLREKAREVVSLVFGAYHGAMDHTQTFLVMTHDSSDGTMVMEDDRLRIKWPGVGKQEIFKKVKKNLKQAAKALGGTYVPNPAWTKLFGHDLVTVHPLGGCVMANEASKGVVNHKSQVFSSNTGTDVHEGLYVADGAVIPMSLGTNPLLTISAVAERNIALLAKDRGWTIDYTLPSRPKHQVIQN